MSDETQMSKDELLTAIQHGWDELQAFINSLTETELTTPTDAAGWTVKDHLIHMAVWEDGVVALLTGKSRLETMGIDEATWESGNFDKINAVIQQREKHMLLADVLKTLEDVHRRMKETITNLSNDDLRLPYNHFQPGSKRDYPVIEVIIGDTFAHYEEHLPWMAAIVGRA